MWYCDWYNRVGVKGVGAGAGGGANDWNPWFGGIQPLRVVVGLHAYLGLMAILCFVLVEGVLTGVICSLGHRVYVFWVLRMPLGLRKILSMSRLSVSVGFNRCHRDYLHLAPSSGCDRHSAAESFNWQRPQKAPWC